MPLRRIVFDVPRLQSGIGGRDLLRLRESWTQCAQQARCGHGADGKLTPINSQAPNGNGPCHLAIDETGKTIVVSNYGDGSVSSLAISADGPAALSFNQLIIGGLDVLGPIGDAMKAGKTTGFSTAAVKKEQGLTLSNFTALTEFIGGKLRLQKPIEADTPLGKMKIEGTTGLDAKLDLRSTLQLTPQMIATMTGGKVKVKEPVPVPMKIGGTWDKPQVSGIDVKSLLAAVIGDAAKDVIDKGKDAAKDAAEDAAKDALGNLLGGGKKKKKK
jgi:hypothetical protein